MARKKVESEAAIKSWSEVDIALRQIAECENLLIEQAVELNRRTAEVKEQSTGMCKPIQNRIKQLEQQLKEFTDSHRAELDGKSKVLTFGTVGYRLSTSVTFPKDKEPQIIALLKQLDLLDCITSKEVVNKDVLKQKTPDIVSGVGACLSVKDGFGYETNREQLHAAEGWRCRNDQALYYRAAVRIW